MGARVGARVEVVEVVVIVAVVPFLLVVEEATVGVVVVEQHLIFESFGMCLGTWSSILLLTLD